MTLLLVRHPPVALKWRGRCYGRSDMGLSRAGAAMAQRLVTELTTERPTLVVHSGLIRTRGLAEQIARATGAELCCDPRWSERDFGGWEGRSWHAIWRETGDAMDGMLTDPHGFRPGGGETTGELAARAAAAQADLPRDRRTIVISHGGPIAAALMAQAGSDFDALAGLIPKHGGVHRMDDSPAQCSQSVIGTET